jgi:MtfA peptidase
MTWWRRSRGTVVDADVIEALVTSTVALAARLDPATRGRLVELTGVLVDAFGWEATDGMVLTDEMRVTIAANAAVPVLELDVGVYAQVRAVIVRPSAARSSGRRAGPAVGTVDESPMWTTGVAMPGTGPVAISWDAALHDSAHPERGHNLVIHEFAHKIDMSDGDSDGVPPLRGAARAQWHAMVTAEFSGADEAAHAVLGDYAWTNPAELFAVASEAFFCTPSRLAHAAPALYDGLGAFYGQDPRTWSGAR